VARKVIVAAFVSLDGVMQAPGATEEDTSGGFKYGGWLVPLADDDPVFAEAESELFRGPFDLLLGRRTYDIFAAHWPYYPEGGPADFIAKRFNGVTKYVATRSREPLTWKGAVALPDAAADVAKLKTKDGPPLLTQGSSELIQTLLAHDLVDEVNVMTFPLLLGTGKKLFGSGARPAAFELTYSRVSPNGIVIARYDRAGEVQTGDYSLDPPAPAELARREQLKREG
jgi:dihydrofolate reductase